MSTPMMQNLEKLLGTPRDGPLLRFSLGNEYLKANDTGKAAVYFRAAVEQDPHYSAAWKQLGHALLANNEPVEAIAAWLQGVQVAEKRGDKQAAREMTVCLKRARKALDPGDSPLP
ncbi:MAG: tetratricopeptide repeat protein [Betaproteobacteria bacterium]|nr:tetratricopeptide repeat protein [Betaproteobacteria bacterium]